MLAVLALLALAGNAGATITLPPPSVPDAGSSAGLLSLALAGLVGVRSFFGKR